MTTTTIFQNGRFFTASGGPKQPEQPSFAESMIVTGSKITFIGSSSSAAVQQARDTGAAVHDLAGRVVVPGFVDGHMHLMQTGQFLQAAPLDGCKDLADIRRVIGAWASEHQQQPRITCRGWMHSMTDGRALASMLDDLDSRPVYVHAKDLHSTWCNSAALAEMGIDEKYADVPGGTISRDENGKPTGLLSEAANIDVVWPFLAKAASVEERIARLEAAITEYSAAGYTGVVEMAMDETAWAALQALLQRRRDRQLPPPPIRIAAHWLISPKDTDAANLVQVDRAAALHEQFNLETTSACRIAGIKVICDGVIDACTAALSEPYSSTKIDCPTIWPPAALLPVVQRAAYHGLQIALHAIGDAAITQAIDALEASQPLRRPRIEHLELASAADAARLAPLGITASIQPGHADPAILRAWPQLLGAHRCGRAFAYADFLARGAVLALGTDSPTAPHAVFPGWYTASTRRSAREQADGRVVNEVWKLGLASVVAAQTAGAAWSCFAEGVAGRLEVGLSADFVVLGMEWEPSKVVEGRVLETWFEGEKVFDAKA